MHNFVHPRAIHSSGVDCTTKQELAGLGSGKTLFLVHVHVWLACQIRSENGYEYNPDRLGRWLYLTSLFELIVETGATKATCSTRSDHSSCWENADKSANRML